MRKYFVLFSACCAIVIIALHFGTPGSHRHATYTRQVNEKILESARLPRPVYRFSVIPGGAYSAEELASARRNDPVVRAHYADFQTDGVSMKRLGGDTYMYVSYRKANRVYWTVKKHRIPKGEPVLSDGAHIARARCGNRLSLIPMTPTLPGLQLPEEAFNAPEPPLDLPTAPLLSPPYDAPDLPFAFVLPRIQGFPATPGTVSPPLVAPIAGFFGPLIGPIGLAGTTRPGNSGGSPGGTGGTGGTGGGGSTSTGATSGGGTTLGSVPEPSVLSLLAAGCAILLGFRARRRFSRSRPH